MTISHWIRLSITAVTLFSFNARAQAQCASTPEKYRDLEYGDARFAVEESCRRAFTQNEQFFLAGIARTLNDKCKLPRDPAGRSLFARLTKAATLSLDLRKPPGPLDDKVPTGADRTTAFAAGVAMMEDTRCDGPEAALLARGLVIYLKRTSATSLFVPGCVEFYEGRYGESECRCIAKSIRAELPDVDQRFFDREIVRGTIHHSPTTALTLIFSCGVVNY